MITRREFVVRSACAGLCAALGCAPGGPGTSNAEGSDASAAPDGPAPRELRVALAAIPAAGALDPTPAGCGDADSAIVVRDAAGIFATSNRCTHAGGRVTVRGEALRCCLHGSTYDLDGAVSAGVVPGQRDLPHLVVRIEGSDVVVSLDVEQPDRNARVTA